jgi:phosphatidylglycerophosphatase A
MKCPKCHYIGFEPSDRCRNCGFDFSLTAPGAAVPEPDLPMRPAESAGPLADFDLGDARRPPATSPLTRAGRRRHDDSLDPGALSPAVAPTDLPLFGELPPDDVPLVRPAGSPTPPLSVRRSTPAPARSRAPLTRRTPERAPDVLPLDTTAAGAADLPPAPPAGSAPAGELAPLGMRLGAAILDWALLIGLDVAIVYFTLKASRLSTAEVLLLPPAPMAAFLLLLNGGYLALFTAAGGQTIGKMAFGLRVVSAGDGPLTVGRSLLRVAACLIGAAAAGLGLLPVGRRRSADGRPFAAARGGVPDRCRGRRARPPPGGVRHGTARRTRSPGSHAGRARMTKRLAIVLATFGYVGHFPIAPGTAGSAAALVLYAGLQAIARPLGLGPTGSLVLDVAVIAVLFAAGTWAGSVAEGHYGRTDPGAVVLDEVVGMLVTLLMVPVTWTGAVAGFLLFRVFDIVKPFPARQCERLHGGFGIMADDAVAGLYGNLALRLVIWLAPSLR